MNQQGFIVEIVDDKTAKMRMQRHSCLLYTSKKNEIVDFHGKNFEKLKNEIINEIEKEYENEKELNEDFESEEKVSLESELKTKKSKSISDLQELIEKTDIKYENNIETLRDY